MPAATRLIAPCGINCGVCSFYLRSKNPCPGCLNDNRHKSDSCRRCRIKTCAVLSEHGYRFCFKCKNLPCETLKRLEKRYRTKYHVNVLENLEDIRRIGVREFAHREKERWACEQCGDVVCMHTARCSGCGAAAHFSE